MPDENSTQVGAFQTSQNNQAVEENSKNEFVLDFGDGENVSEVNTSEVNTSEVNTSEEQDNAGLDFNIEENQTEENSDSEMDFNQDELFSESVETKDEGSDLGNLDINSGTEESVAEENDDFSMDMNLDSDSKTDTDPKQINMVEDNNESLDTSEISNVDVKLDENIDGENEMQIENNQDEASGETIEENQQLESEDIPQVEELGLGGQDKQLAEDSDFSIDINSDPVGVIDNGEENLGLEKGKSENEDMGTNVEIAAPEGPLETSSEVQVEDIQNEQPGEKNNEDFNLNVEENSVAIEEPQEENLDFALETNDEDNQEKENDEEVNDFNINLNQEEGNMNNNSDNLDVNFEANEPNQNDQILMESEIQNNIESNELQDSSESHFEEQSNLESISNDNIQVEENNKSEEVQDFVSNEPNEENNLDTTQENLGTENGPVNDEIAQDNDDSVNDIQNQVQEPSVEASQTIQTNENGTQPDMMNLLGGQSVDFSYEENAETIQQQGNNAEPTQNEVENNQGVVEPAVQDSIIAPVLNTEATQNVTTEEKAEVNIVTNEEINTQMHIPTQAEVVKLEENVVENTVNNVAETTPELGTNSESQNVVQSPVVNSATEISAPQASENVPTAAETVTIKSTLSLDEILDSELQTNPQFADNSKAVPKNVPIKSSSKNKRIVTVCARIGIFALLGCVAVLAFPSFTTERKSGDVVDTESVVEIINEGTPTIEEQTEVSSEKIEVSEEKSQLNEDEYRSDGTPIGQHNAPTVEFPEDTVDDTDNGENNTEDKPNIIAPYVEIEPEDVQNENSYSTEDIQSQISSFKIQAEGYKEMGENGGNAKIIKYATYIIHMCDDYQTQVDNGESTDDESFSSFKTQVLEFMGKIEENLNSANISTEIG